MLSKMILTFINLFLGIPMLKISMPNFNEASLQFSLSFTQNQRNKTLSSTFLLSALQHFFGILLWPSLESQEKSSKCLKFSRNLTLFKKAKPAMTLKRKKKLNTHAHAHTQVPCKRSIINGKMKRKVGIPGSSKNRRL